MTFGGILFVRTRAIQQAVVGHQTEVLDALGIDWRAGNPHIVCPYRDHSDRNPSWRWDSKYSRARCSCSVSDSIFDVVLKVEGCDFEAAKLRIARILHRDDLIETKREAPEGVKYQATDAASLLSAPAESRDDSLPVAYLAYRLGVSSGAVPIPFTPMVGLKALGYFDPPPAGSRAKPKLVGYFPCAVFGTIGADRRTHAHRIYLAEGGHGKADLGAGPSGQPRNAKKSARIIGDDNIAGRSVLWGDPSRAPHIILAEGIETAAAAALAFTAEICAGEIAVAAAISATGIEAFEPHPATTHVTVAADRDEAPKRDGSSGSRRGERAARIFALKHYQRLTLAIGLPGVSDKSIDWLDILRRDGADAVRTGLLNARPFSLTDEELAGEEREQSVAARLEQIAKSYPLPHLQNMRLAYRFTDNGRIWVHKLVSHDGGEEHWIPVDSPFGISARLRYCDQGDAYGLRALVEDMNGRPRAVDFDRAGLARMAASEIRSALYSAGLRTEADGENIAVQCLKAADPAQEIIVIRRPGWHEIPGCTDPIFLRQAVPFLTHPRGSPSSY